MTQRLLINLPDGQKTFIRINHKTPFDDILLLVCDDKGLEADHHWLLHPTEGRALDPALSPEDFGINEVTLAAKPGILINLLTDWLIN